MLLRLLPSVGVVIIAVIMCLCDNGVSSLNSNNNHYLHDHKVHLPEALNSQQEHFSGYLTISLLGIQGVTPGETATKAKVFYYYTKAQDNINATEPTVEPPLIVWMTGGPGASSLIGLFNELGPFLINSRSRPKALQSASSSSAEKWTLFANPHAWSTQGSLLGWEQPAGVGFSRCIDGPCPTWNDDSSAEANLRVLLAFFAKYPEEQVRDLLITGESYAGVYVPMLAMQVHNHNKNGNNEVGQPSSILTSMPKYRGSDNDKLNLKGIIVGNGCVGFAETGGCGRDSMALLLRVLDKGAPGISNSITDHALQICGVELEDDAQNADDLSPSCRKVSLSCYLKVDKIHGF